MHTPSWLDRVVVRLEKLDAYAGVKIRPKGGEEDNAPGHHGRWRERPTFYWDHHWGRGDGFAAILVVVGLVDAVTASGSDSARVALGLGLIVLGAALFAVLSLMPPD